MEERRKTPRRKIYKAGMIITHDRFSTVNCVVRNLSDAGAGIDTETAVLLPARFELLFDGRSCNCELAWHSQRRVGVRFA
jgi:hypothetical protein